MDIVANELMSFNKSVHLFIAIIPEKTVRIGYEVD